MGSWRGKRECSLEREERKELEVEWERDYRDRRKPRRKLGAFRLYILVYAGGDTVTCAALVTPLHVNSELI